MTRHCLIPLLLIIALAGAPARAAEEDSLPYDGNLQRLAEILDALHYLRPLCGSNEGQKWRYQMQALVDAETAPNSDRRNRMVASFNRGFRIFQKSYRTCTPAAESAMQARFPEAAAPSADDTVSTDSTVPALSGLLISTTVNPEPATKA